MAELTDHELREHVRARYSDAALRMADRDATAGCGCGCETTDRADACCTDAPADAVFGADLYAGQDTGGAPQAAVSASLGCGVPTAVADLHEGETVLDLGSGAGADVLISARRVGRHGSRDRPRHDRRDARAGPCQRRPGGGRERRVRQGLPGGDPAARRQRRRRHLELRHQPRRRQGPRPARGGACPRAGRTLRGLRRHRRSRHGRGDARRHGSSGPAASPAHSRAPSTSSALAEAGLVDVEIREMHRVHEHAASAIVRARRPQPAPA